MSYGRRHSNNNDNFIPVYEESCASTLTDLNDYDLASFNAFDDPRVNNFCSNILDDIEANDANDCVDDYDDDDDDDLVSSQESTISIPLFPIEAVRTNGAHKGSHLAGEEQDRVDDESTITRSIFSQGEYKAANPYESIATNTRTGGWGHGTSLKAIDESDDVASASTPVQEPLLHPSRKVTGNAKSKNTISESLLSHADSSLFTYNLQSVDEAENSHRGDEEEITFDWAEPESFAYESVAPTSRLNRRQRLLQRWGKKPIIIAILAFVLLLIIIIASSVSTRDNRSRRGDTPAKIPNGNTSGPLTTSNIDKGEESNISVDVIDFGSDNSIDSDNDNDDYSTSTQSGSDTSASFGSGVTRPSFGTVDFGSDDDMTATLQPEGEDGSDSSQTLYPSDVSNELGDDIPAMPTIDLSGMHVPEFDDNGEPIILSFGEGSNSSDKSVDEKDESDEEVDTTIDAEDGLSIVLQTNANFTFSPAKILNSTTANKGRPVLLSNNSSLVDPAWSVDFNQSSGSLIVHDLTTAGKNTGDNLFSSSNLVTYPDTMNTTTLELEGSNNNTGNGTLLILHDGSSTNTSGPNSLPNNSTQSGSGNVSNGNEEVTQGSRKPHTSISFGFDHAGDKNSNETANATHTDSDSSVPSQAANMSQLPVSTGTNLQLPFGEQVGSNTSPNATLQDVNSTQSIVPHTEIDFGLSSSSYNTVIPHNIDSGYNESTLLGSNESADSSLPLDGQVTSSLQTNEESSGNSSGRPVHTEIDFGIQSSQGFPSASPPTSLPNITNTPASDDDAIPLKSELSGGNAQANGNAGIPNSPTDNAQFYAQPSQYVPPYSSVTPGTFTSTLVTRVPTPVPFVATSPAAQPPSLSSVEQQQQQQQKPSQYMAGSAETGTKYVTRPPQVEVDPTPTTSRQYLYRPPSQGYSYQPKRAVTNESSFVQSSATPSPPSTENATTTTITTDTTVLAQTQDDTVQPIPLSRSRTRGETSDFGPTYANVARPSTSTSATNASPYNDMLLQMSSTSDTNNNDNETEAISGMYSGQNPPMDNESMSGSDEENQSLAEQVESIISGNDAEFEQVKEVVEHIFSASNMDPTQMDPSAVVAFNASTWSTTIAPTLVSTNDTEELLPSFISTSSPSVVSLATNSPTFDPFSYDYHISYQDAVSSAAEAANSSSSILQTQEPQVGASQNEVGAGTAPPSTMIPVDPIQPMMEYVNDTLAPTLVNQTTSSNWSGDILSSYPTATMGSPDLVAPSDNNTLLPLARAASNEVEQLPVTATQSTSSSAKRRKKNKSSSSHTATLSSQTTTPPLDNVAVDQIPPFANSGNDSEFNNYNQIVEQSSISPPPEQLSEEMQTKIVYKVLTRPPEALITFADESTFSTSLDENNNTGSDQSIENLVEDSLTSATAVPSSAAPTVSATIASESPTITSSLVNTPTMLPTRNISENSDRLPVSSETTTIPPVSNAPSSAIASVSDSINFPRCSDDIEDMAVHHPTLSPTRDISENLLNFAQSASLSNTSVVKAARISDTVPTSSPTRDVSEHVDCATSSTRADPYEDSEQVQNTYTPSAAPSIVPSTLPSALPSLSPSALPSALPTATVTEAPTTQPSKATVDTNSTLTDEDEVTYSGEAISATLLIDGTEYHGKFIPHESNSKP